MSLCPTAFSGSSGRSTSRSHWPTGMMVGALVAGNTVVCKPSDKTPRSTAAVAAIWPTCFLPGVVNVVHGGADIGRALAETDVDGVAFTGSAEVGWQLIAGTTPKGLPRPVLAEMGGQNPAVVGASADLDAAAAASSAPLRPVRTEMQRMPSSRRGRRGRGRTHRQDRGEGGGSGRSATRSTQGHVHGSGDRRTDRHPHRRGTCGRRRKTVRC